MGKQRKKKPLKRPKPPRLTWRENLIAAFFLLVFFALAIAVFSGSMWGKANFPFMDPQVLATNRAGYRGGMDYLWLFVPLFYLMIASSVVYGQIKNRKFPFPGIKQCPSPVSNKSVTRKQALRRGALLLGIYMLLNAFGLFGLFGRVELSAHSIVGYNWMNQVSSSRSLQNAVGIKVEINKITGYRRRGRILKVFEPLLKKSLYRDYDMTYTIQFQDGKSFRFYHNDFRDYQALKAIDDRLKDLPKQFVGKPLRSYFILDSYLTEEEGEIIDAVFEE